MTIRRASVILPCRGFDDFPTHLAGPGAADLLAAVTGLWHPALIHATQALPGWHRGRGTARSRGAGRRIGRHTVVEPRTDRVRLGGSAAGDCAAESVRRSMRFRPAKIRLRCCSARRWSIWGKVTDGECCQFSCARIRAHAGGADHTCAALYKRARYRPICERGCGSCQRGDCRQSMDLEREELGRAFDLLSDARNHVYSVDFYVIDVTLLADSTLGKSLRKKTRGRLTNRLAHHGRAN